MRRAPLVLAAALLGATAHAEPTLTSSGAEALRAPPPPPVEPLTLFAHEGAAAAAAGLVAAPVALGLGAAWGSAPSNLVLAALPSLLTLIVLPPAASSASAWWVGDDRSPGTERFWPTLGVSAGAQLGVVVLAAALGANAREPRDVIVFSVVDAAVLGGVVAGSLWLFRPDPTEVEP